MYREREREKRERERDNSNTRWALGAHLWRAAMGGMCCSVCYVFVKATGGTRVTKMGVMFYGSDREGCMI